MTMKSVVISLMMIFSSVITTQCDEQDDLEMMSNSGDAFAVEEIETVLQDHEKRGTSGSRLTYEERVDFLKAHNDYRRNVNPPASNMQFMVWNEELAAMAQEWADQCLWKHGNPQRNPKPFPYIGQNIHATTARSVTGRSVTTSWHNEVKFYTYSNNKCADGKACGHYTQVVWAKSNNLGCATASCPQLVGTQMKNAKFTVCNYGPGGNYLGRRPYLEGRKCSACPSGTRCRSDMCVSRPKCGGKSCANGGRLNFATCECRCPPNYNGPDCSIKGAEAERNKREGQRSKSVDLLYALIRDMLEDKSLRN